jgi:hypothetical protein
LLGENPSQMAEDDKRQKRNWPHAQVSEERSKWLLDWNQLEQWLHGRDSSAPAPPKYSTFFWSAFTRIKK